MNFEMYSDRNIIRIFIFWLLVGYYYIYLKLLKNKNFDNVARHRFYDLECKV